MKTKPAAHACGAFAPRYDRLGIAIAKRTYKAYLGLLSSPRWLDDFPNYAAGSTGPAAADRLLARDGRAWLPITPGHPHAERSA
jgi:hypothetical protein